MSRQPELALDKVYIRLVCAGKFNDLATAFMSNQDETIKHIFSLGRLSRKYEVCKDDNCYFTLQTLFILTITYWVFMVLLGGIVIPGGLFMPSIMVTILSLAHPYSDLCINVFKPSAASQRVNRGIAHLESPGQGISDERQTTAEKQFAHGALLL